MLLLFGLRGTFAAARGGFLCPVLKGEKIQLLKINNLWHKLSDYYSLHVRLRVILLRVRLREREGAGVP